MNKQKSAKEKADFKKPKKEYIDVFNFIPNNCWWSLEQNKITLNIDDLQQAISETQNDCEEKIKILNDYVTNLKEVVEYWQGNYYEAYNLLSEDNKRKFQKNDLDKIKRRK